MNLDFTEWIGKTQTRFDQITAAPVAGWSAALDREDAYPQPGECLPPLWHWLYFLAHDRQSDLGVDGHAKLGRFLPPSPLPRRMWAGSRLQFHHPLKVGDKVRRESQILDVTEKTGQSGPLMFVVVRHEVSNDQGVALTEEHDIVYRDHAKVDEPKSKGRPAPGESTWNRSVQPDDVLLFRYSALTFNAHRIHYDRRYAAETEGYPGLVVHGPLIATLMLDLLHRNRPAATISSFRFRAVRPLFDTGPFQVCGRGGDDQHSILLWASNDLGELAAEAEVATAG